MRISDWSSDVFSSDLYVEQRKAHGDAPGTHSRNPRAVCKRADQVDGCRQQTDDGELEIHSSELLASCPAVRTSPSDRSSHRPGRSEERRVGTTCVSTCRSRWAPAP